MCVRLTVLVLSSASMNRTKNFWRARCHSLIWGWSWLRSAVLWSCIYDALKPWTCWVAPHSTASLASILLLSCTKVTDYLLKPIRQDCFLKAVQKAAWQHQIQQKESAGSVRSVEPQTVLFVKTGRSYVPVQLTDIQYIEGLKDYVLIHTPTDRLVTALTLKHLDGTLPPTQFRRVNKSCIINLYHIERVENDLLVVGGRELTLGDSYRAAFFQDVIAGKKLGDSHATI
jgi:hypothetical protein